MISPFDYSWWLWFNIALVLLLAVDIKFLRSPKATMSVKQSALTTFSWVMLAMLFCLLIFATHGIDPALNFLTGYVIEQSLSIDNLFVFLMIFQHFKVPSKMQAKILMYGILGALIMRLSLIFVGITLVEKAHFVMYFFGIFLMATGILMFNKKEESYSPKTPFIIRILQKFLPITDVWEGDSFFVRKAGKLFATTAFVVLMTVESTDLIFALDSVPAVFAVTLDPFIVYSCNALAILGLRSLFFVLKDGLDLFTYLHHGVCLILMFVGGKMLLEPFLQISTVTSLSVIGTIIFSTLFLSSIMKKKDRS